MMRSYLQVGELNTSTVTVSMQEFPNSGNFTSVRTTWALEANTPFVVVVLFGALGVADAPCRRLVSLIIGVCELPVSRSTVSALVGSDCWIQPTITYTTRARSTLLSLKLFWLTWLFVTCALLVSRLSLQEVVWWWSKHTYSSMLVDEVAAKKPSQMAFDCQYRW